MTSKRFETSAGFAAVVVGIVGLLYSVSFVVIARTNAALGATLTAIFLLVGGVLSIQALVAVYRRVRDTDAGFALAGFLFGFAGAVGASIHGGYDLANVTHPPSVNLGDLPHPVDPRGLLTFGFAGLGILVLSRLIQRGGTFPLGLAWLGYLSGALLIVIYLGRLIVLDASSFLILVPAGLEGFVVNPLWYVWLGVALLRGSRA